MKAAQKAFEGTWSKLFPKERAIYLKAIAEQLRENAEHLGKIETIDTGKLFKETKTQANYIAEYYDYYAGLADKVEGTVLPIDKANMQGITTRVPIGVVAAIIPWNSQMLLTAVKLAPALAMGNTIILKASEAAPAPLLELAKLIDSAEIEGLEFSSLINLAPDEYAHHWREIVKFLDIVTKAWPKILSEEVQDISKNPV